MKISSLSLLVFSLLTVFAPHAFSLSEAPCALDGLCVIPSAASEIKIRINYPGVIACGLQVSFGGVVSEGNRPALAAEFDVAELHYAAQDFSQPSHTPLSIVTHEGSFNLTTLYISDFTKSESGQLPSLYVMTVGLRTKSGRSFREILQKIGGLDSEAARTIVARPYKCAQ